MITYATEKIRSLIDRMEKTKYLKKLIDKPFTEGIQNLYYKIKMYYLRQERIEDKDGIKIIPKYRVIIQADNYYGQYEYDEENGPNYDTIEVHLGEYHNSGTW